MMWVRNPYQWLGVWKFRGFGALGLLKLLHFNILGEYKSDHSKNVYELIDRS